MTGFLIEAHSTFWLWVDKHMKLKYLHAHTHMCAHTHNFQQDVV